jgi:HTH-type transcriptional regulator / antitoxin HigA
MEAAALRRFTMATIRRAGTGRDEYLELVQRLPLKPIRNSRQLRAAHRVIDELTKIPEHRLSRDQLDYLEVLGDLTTAYENRLMKAELKGVNGLDVLKHLLEANDMSASDLGRLLGQREFGSKILRGERSISRSHARRLGERFGLPAETFLRD